MKNIQTMFTQDISDVLSAARLCLCEKTTSIQAEMFRGLFGGLFLEGFRPSFGDRLNAYNDNKHRIAEVLANLAEELERRGF